MPTFTPAPLELMFWEALALIIAACIFAPIFRKLGFGTILGYLVAGIVVKLSLATSFAEHPEDLLHFAEFGVVLFLFVIGLELNPSSLWSMRKDIFGLGLAQVLICGIALAIPPLLMGLSWQISLVIGMGLSLSSTALVMRTLDERRERTTTYGRKSFAILLFQDLAIVPLLFLAALLAPTRKEISLGSSLIELTTVVGAIVILIIIGRYLLNPALRLLSKANMQEIMTAAALGIVIFASLIMDLAGMSYAMGAFIAGVMLADSDFRHEIEANVEPFRGLFLGLFFMAVGLSLNLEAIIAQWPIVLAAAPILMITKSIVIYILSRFTGNTHNNSVKTAFTLSQAGEFGFVLFSTAATSSLLTGSQASTLIAIITVSMAISPIYERLSSLWLTKQTPETIDENFDDASGNILMIGFGRFGQIVAQPLYAQGIEVTILDSDVSRIKSASAFGFRIHFGDVTRRDVLRAAGADNATLIAVCVDRPQTATKIVDVIKAHFPHAKIFVRSYDRGHSIELARRNVDYSIRETFESALVLAKETLTAIGIEDRIANRTIDDIRVRDKIRLEAQIDGDINSGLDQLHVKPLKPEPLPPAV